MQKRRPRTAEEKAKISATLKGRKFTDAHRRELSQSASQRWDDWEEREKVSRSLQVYYRQKKLAQLLDCNEEPPGLADGLLGAHLEDLNIIVVDDTLQGV